MAEAGREMGSGACCLCLSEDESTFHTNSIMKSLPLHEMVNFCIGIEVNAENDDEKPLSSAICNECVLNINNFYVFKKKVLEAQELIGSLKQEATSEDMVFVDEEMMQMHNLNEETDVIETEQEQDDESEKIELYADSVPRRDTIQVTHMMKIENVKKRPNDTNDQAKIVNKKPKVDVIVSERVTIQMNECLICPAVLGDILQLKDHIDAHADIKCKACKRPFARYSNLKRHFNTVHSKPKPFQCDLCGLGFNFSVNLQSHAALHYSNKIRKE